MSLPFLTLIVLLAVLGAWLAAEFRGRVRVRIITGFIVLVTVAIAAFIWGRFVEALGHLEFLEPHDSPAQTALMDTGERLPEFVLAPAKYGWTGKFPGGPWRIFDKEISIEIDTRAVPNGPKALPSVSASQAGLVHKIIPALPAILTQVEQAMVKYNDHEPDFRKYITNPQVWLSSEKDDGQTWAFVIERTDNPDFGYHTEFKGTNFIEIWAGD